MPIETLRPMETDRECIERILRGGNEPVEFHENVNMIEISCGLMSGKTVFLWFNKDGSFHHTSAVSY